jgi:hypothetical protein
VQGQSHRPERTYSDFFDEAELRHRPEISVCLYSQSHRN